MITLLRNDDETRLSSVVPHQGFCLWINIICTL